MGEEGEGGEGEGGGRGEGRGGEGRGSVAYTCSPRRVLSRFLSICHSPEHPRVTLEHEEGVFHQVLTGVC